MGQIQYMLREVCRLDDAPNLDPSFFLNELPNGIKKRRRELWIMSAFTQINCDG